MNVHSDYYEKLDIEYDSAKLIEESAMVDYSPFRTGKKTNTWFDNQDTWDIGRVDDNRTYLEVHRLKKMIETLTGSILCTGKEFECTISHRPEYRMFDQHHLIEPCGTDLF